MHKYHHEYKSPVVYCDLFIHPLEAIGYYCILYSPAFILKNIPKESFLLYMAILGVFGVLRPFRRGYSLTVVSLLLRGEVSRLAPFKVQRELRVSVPVARRALRYSV